VASEKDLNEEIPEEEQNTLAEEAEETVTENEPAEETGETEEPTEAAADGENAPETGETKEKKSFFKKKEKKDERDEKILELTDKLTRLMAEFDNYRKRTEKEKAVQFDMGAMKVIGKLLPVVDNFERGLTAVPEADRTHSAYTGMDLIYKQTIKMLEDLGVEAINAEGKEFDPNLHNAVMQVEGDGTQEENTVAQELQKGYTYHGSVVRVSMVSVVK